MTLSIKNYIYWFYHILIVEKFDLTMMGVLSMEALTFLHERDAQRVPDAISAALEAIGVCLLNDEQEG